MVDITFPLNHNLLRNSDRIEFEAIVNGKAIPCRITVEELIREYHCRASPSNFEERFLELRPQIQERARQDIIARGIGNA